MAVRMLIRSLVFALAFCLVAQPAVYAQEQAPEQQATAVQAAQPDQDQAATAAQPDESAAIKAELQRIGKGNQAIVVFSDGTTHAGRIKKVGNQTFAMDEGTKSHGDFSYSEVSSVSKPQNNSNVAGKVMGIAFLTSGLVAVAGVVDFAITKSKTGSSGSPISASPAK